MEAISRANFGMIQKAIRMDAMLMYEKVKAMRKQ